MNVMQKITDFLLQQWVLISGISGIVAGIMTGLAIFVRDLLTIKKLRIEIANLKKSDTDNKKDKLVIYRATIEEIIKYGYPDQTTFQSDFRKEVRHGQVHYFNPIMPSSKLIIAKRHKIFIWPVVIITSTIVFYFTSWNIYSLVVLFLVYSVTRFLIFFCFGSRVEQQLEKWFDFVWKQVGYSTIDFLRQQPRAEIWNRRKF